MVISPYISSAEYYVDNPDVMRVSSSFNQVERHVTAGRFRVVVTTLAGQKMVKARKLRKSLRYHSGSLEFHLSGFPVPHHTSTEVLGSMVKGLADSVGSGSKDLAFIMAGSSGSIPGHGVDVTRMVGG
jgi:hypothetical protein